MKAAFLESQSAAVVLDALACGAMVLDAAERIVYVNPVLADTLGCAAAALEGKRLDGLPYAGDGEEGAHGVVALRSALAEGAEAAVRFRRSDGTIVATLAASTALPDGPDGLVYRLVTIADISTAKTAEQRAQDQFAIVSRLSDTVIEQALELRKYAQTLEQRVRDRTEALREANMDAIFMLAVACEAKDLDTGAHVLRIQEASRGTALALGLGEAKAEEIGYCAILHDVGKMTVPDRILQKPGKLTAEERKLMEEHTLSGERILSTKAFFAVARQIARSHHENWDGSGYPDGLRGDAIPLPARIVHVADVFDALTNARVYKAAWPLERALAYLDEQAGGMFDPEAAAAFGRFLQRAGRGR